MKDLRNLKVYWNTGARYTEHGQRMGAYWDGTYIHYVDVDRGLSGSVKCCAVYYRRAIQELAQLAYDKNLGERHMLDHDARNKFEQEVLENAPSNKREDD